MRFGLFARQLTISTNHYVDWARAGEFIRSGTHRYTFAELRARAGIIAFTALSGFLGAYWNDEEKTHCSDTTVAIAATLAGFIVSHGVSMAPLIMKRYEISCICAKLQDDINEKLSHFVDEDDTVQLTVATVQSIMQLSLNSELTRASQVWNRRMMLLTRVSEQLNSDQQARNKFWQGDVDNIVKKLGTLAPQESESPSMRM